MEYGSRLRFALFALGGILLLVLSIWGITSLAHRVIVGEPDTKSTVKKINLADYNKPSSFLRVTVQGPIVATENHKSYQIDVGQNFRDLKIFSGYNKTVVSEKQFSNDSAAYQSFLKGLKQVNFTAKNNSYGPDETGYCPSGQRFVYELFDKGETVSHAWYTTCGFGTYLGFGQSTRSLFRAQIPDFDALTSSLQL